MLALKFAGSCVIPTKVTKTACFGAHLCQFPGTTTIRMQALLPCGVSARHLSHRGASSSSHPETSEPCRCHLTWSRCAPDSHTQVQRRAFSYQTGAEASRLVAHAASVVEAGPLTAIGVRLLKLGLLPVTTREDLQQLSLFLQHGPYETVEDLMTKKRVFTCRADTSIDEGQWLACDGCHRQASLQCIG